MQRQLQCPKCEGVYSSQNPPKRLINCAHTLCLRCLKEEIVCPLDRKRIERRKYTLEAFKNNEEIVTLMQSKAEAEQGDTVAILNEQSHEKIANSNRGSSRKEEGAVESHVSVGCQAETAHSLPAVEQPSVTITEPTPVSPAKQKNIQFDTCLLHSKRADLICLQDKCLICSSCGLFGEHKLHKIMPYDTFLTNFSSLTEECLKTQDLLRQREDKLSLSVIHEQIVRRFQEKKEREVRSIKANVAFLVELVRRYERELLANLEQTVAYKQGKFIDSVCLDELIAKKREYQSSVEKVSAGIEEVFSLENIEAYVPFVDQNSPDSFVIKEGEYLILQIDNYWKEVQTRLELESNEFTLKFREVDLDLFKDIAKIESSDEKEIHKLIQENKGKALHKNGKLTTPRQPKNNLTSSTGKPPLKPSTPVVQNEEDLLIGSNEQRQSPSPPPKNHISPIQPVQHFEYNIESHFAGSLRDQTRTDQTETEVKYIQIPMASSLRNSLSQKRLQQRKTVCTVNRSIGVPSLASYNSKRLDDRKQNEMQSATRQVTGSMSKPSSTNNSNFTTERELLSVLNERNDNKRKKRIELPEKYAKVYDDLCKDKLDVLDLGGACLGESTLLHISEFFPSRNRLKSVKLMSNKISDELFPELVSRCTHVYSLNLSYNLLTERSLEWLEREAGRLGELQNITLSNNKIVLRNVKDRLETLRRKGVKISL